MGGVLASSPLVSDPAGTWAAPAGTTRDPGQKAEEAPGQALLPPPVWRGCQSGS